MVDNSWGLQHPGPGSDTQKRVMKEELMKSWCRSHRGITEVVAAQSAGEPACFSCRSESDRRAVNRRMGGASEDGQVDTMT